MKVIPAVALLALLACSAPAAEVKTVLEGLDNPCGIAVQPETGVIFVADSGAKRIIRVVDGKAEDVITDFPVDVYGKGPHYNIGPLGLAFTDQNTLVVGGGGFTDDKELLRIYDVPKAGESITADKMKASFTLEANEELAAEGNYYGVTANAQGIFVTCNGDDTKGWIARLKVEGDKFGPFERFIASKEETDIDAPVAITTAPRGHLVVGQMGEITTPEDGLLTFYNAKSGKMLLNLEAGGLSDITGLAYSAGDNPQLYALDFAWATRDDKGVTKGGLFKLVKEGRGKDQTVNAKHVVDLNQPTALAFGADGTLYVALGNDNKAEKTGKLVTVSLE